MTARDVAAGLFCVLLGAVGMAAYAYRKQIRLYLQLEKSGTVDAVGDLASGFKSLYDQIQGSRPKPRVLP